MILNLENSAVKETKGFDELETSSSIAEKSIRAM